MLALIKQTVFLCLCVLRFGDVVKLPKTASRILSFFSFLNENYSERDKRCPRVLFSRGSA